MLFTRSTQVTVAIDAKTMKKLGLASEAMSEYASTVIMCADNSAQMTKGTTRR